MTLRVRWLGRVPYREALDLQTALFAQGSDQHLLLLEHPHVFTHGSRADLERNVLVNPAQVGAELVPVNRGGDVTYHGPGQLVGYPICRATADRHAHRSRAQRCRSSARIPGRLGGRGRAESAQDLRDRGPSHARQDDARVRDQRQPGHAVPP